MPLRINSVSKKYGQKTVLKGVDLKLGKGELHVILGPSGEGKSTLLFIIAGFIRQDSGSVFMGDTCLDGVAAFRRPIGFVFQDNALFPHLTVRENIAYGVLGDSAACGKIDHYAEMTGISDVLHHYPHELSGGQKQRVSLSRALIMEPEVLLMDEPLSSVDNLLKDKLVREIKEIQQRLKIRMLYVTHNQDEALKLADKVSILHHGKIVQTGTAVDVFSRPRTRFVAEFVGIKNIFKASLSSLEDETAWFDLLPDGGKTVRIKTRKYPVFQRCREVSFCVRPEDILISDKKEKGINVFPASVKAIDFEGGLAGISVEVQGLNIFLKTDKSRIKKLGENIFIHIPEQAFLPLCQNRFQRMKFDRDIECLCMK